MSTAPPTMMPMEFLQQLPEAHDATDEECPVCLQEYVPTIAPPPGIINRLISMVGFGDPEGDPEPSKTEHPVRLPCQHVLGSECITRWISGGQNTCPYCVQPLFTRMKYPGSNHHIWPMLIEYLGAYGYTMNESGWLHRHRAQAAKAMSVQDVTDSETLAKLNPGISAKLKPGIFAQYLAAGRDTQKLMQELTSARLTVHLREAVLYL